MDLDLTPEQELLGETVRGVCSRYADLTVVRQMEDDAIGYPSEFWSHLAELGLLGMSIPEEHGGSGMNAIDGAVVYMELGRALAPSPHFVSSVLSAGALLRGGATEVLPGIADGSVIVTPAWLEPSGGFGPAGVTLAAAKEGDGFVLDGAKRHVQFARAAHHLLVLARTAEGVTLLLVDTGAPGVTLTQQMTVASDSQYRVDFSGVRVPASAVVGEPGRGWAIWDQVMHDAIILLAAYAVGGARYALEITTEYSKVRRQFDKPLAAFQALSHYMADAATQIDGAETLVWEAAWAKSVGRSIDRLAPMAKLFACNVFRDTTAMAQQIFGGVGFTVDYDIQLYFRRAKQLQLSWWDSRYLEELVAADVLDRVTA
ncbi:MAG TPA: acyl-CoA dehydrogenase family protein [Acidimicrobiales bacterium]|nr:acyl-CoA dehydrogenase family protein [Acidimicrobiales bacterium]